MKTKKLNQIAVISGVTGQDGSYLSEYLLSLGYTVIGLCRRTSSRNRERLYSSINNPNFCLEEFDITDPVSINKVIGQYQPDEFYNLAAQSHVATSFRQPILTFEVNTMGVINILDSIRSCSPHTKFYQASTSEMFGKNYTLSDNGEKYQDENTAFEPQSPYGISKMSAHELTSLYRQSYGIFACCGILFNHESPRRGDLFVTRKITKYLGELLSKKTDKTLKLGNLNASRDWGHAKDYIKAMHSMLQYDIPDDYVVATGETHTVYEFLQLAFDICNLDYKQYVEIDPEMYRPSEVEYLKGNSEKIRKNIGWQPTYSFEDLVKEMVDSDIKNV